MIKKLFCQAKSIILCNPSEAVKKSTQEPNRKDGWIGEALERNLWKVKHCAISLHKHTSLATWPVAGNLNERFLKFWKSTRPFGTKLDETNFSTASQLWSEILSLDQGGLFGENLEPKTMDSFVLEAPVGIVLRDEQEMNPERGSKKKESLAKTGSFHPCFMERKMPSS